MKYCIIILGLYFIKTSSTAILEYEFGDDWGEVIYSKDGIIPFLQFETSIDIPVPSRMQISYIRVTVDAVSSPKVDYDSLYRKINIMYSWTQLTKSSYNILVKGTPIQKEMRESN